MGISNEKKLDKIEQLHEHITALQDQIARCTKMLRYAEGDLAALGINTPIGDAIRSFDDGDIEMSAVVEDIEKAGDALSDKIESARAKAER